jgi:hypothetical protein
MSEYVKDTTQNPSSWRTISYHSTGKQSGGESDGAPLTAEGMDERGEGSDQGGKGDDAAGDAPED